MTQDQIPHPPTHPTVENRRARRARERAVPLRPPATPWRRVLRLAALTTLVSATAMMACGRFLGPSLVVLDLAMLAGLWLLRRPGRAGIVVLALFSLANLLLHGPILALQLTVPEAPASFVTGLGLGVSSVLALVASVPCWRSQPGGRRLVEFVGRSLAGLLTVALVVTAALFATRSSDVVQDHDLRLTTSGTAVSPRQLNSPSGTVTIAVRNDDPLFPRAFDVPAADVHVLVPPRTTRRVSLRLAPGTYDFEDSATATEATTGRIVVTAG